MPETALLIKAVRELTLGEAVREALAEEMRRDPRVFIMGEDVAEAGTAFKVLAGLVQEFGPERVLDTPISEAGFTGIGVGAGDDRNASGGRHHVRRFRRLDHGPDGEPGCQDPLHVGRQMEMLHGAADHARAPHAGRPRNIRSRCTRGSATFRD